MIHHFCQEIVITGHMKVHYKVVTIVTGCHRIRTLVDFNVSVEELTSSSQKIKFQVQAVLQVCIINHLALTLECEWHHC